MNIQLTKTDQFKNYLLLTFIGTSGLGSDGNVDADFIISSAKLEISMRKNIQGVIFDFTQMRYKMGNRFANIFDSNKFRQSKLYIRVLSNRDDYSNWKSLIAEVAVLKLDSCLSENISTAIKSINKEMNP